jgi:chorismate dehydratase
VKAPVHIGAVGYLNARPLTWALDADPQRPFDSAQGALSKVEGRWAIRYDLPSVCSSLLHAGQVDLGLVPSIDYLQDPAYRFVPGVGIGSRGPVASVALYTRVPVERVRSIALDTSSRTSVTLIRVLCRHRFGVAPEFVAHGPDLQAMVAIADAGLLIGDPAFEADHAGLGLQKVDLGQEWTAMTGLPFIYAAWTGRAGAVTDADVEALQEAQQIGVRSVDAIAAEYGSGDAARTARAAAYLRDNVKYGLGPDEAAGLQLFLNYAADLGLAPRRRQLEFF